MNVNEALSVIPRSLISLLILFFITKLIGRKQVSELSLFDYVIGISIGNFAAETTMNFEGQFINGIVAVITFGIFAYLVSILTMKSIFFRRFLMGSPVVIIEDGNILEKSLKKMQIDVNDLLEQIRSGGYFDLNEVAYAIMETNGKISILPKNEYKPVINKDMNIKKEKASLCANVIIDSHIMKNNLKRMNKTEEWLLHELKVKGYTSLENILLATMDENGKVRLYEKNNNAHKLEILE